TTSTTTTSTTTTSTTTSVAIAAVPEGPDPCRTACIVGGLVLDQWHLDAIGVDTPLSAQGESVAVIDSGIDLDHPDLAGLVRRSDCSPGEAFDLDHGTAIAGLITAIGNDARGLAPLVEGVEIVDIPVFAEVDGELLASPAAVAAAIRCAVTEEVSVINLSIANQCSGLEEVEQAIEAALDAGVVIVAAAGNHRAEAFVCPAAFDGVIGVAAADSAGTPITSLASASVVAPGRSVLTAGTVAGRPQTTRSGSSFATAIVSAAASAILAQNPDWSPQRVAVHLNTISHRSVDEGRHLDLSFLGQPLPAVQVLGGDGAIRAVGDVVSVASVDSVHQAATAAAISCSGGWTVDRLGRLQTVGAAVFHGDLSRYDLAADIVGIESTPSGRGYWLVGADGGVFAFGDAGFFGSLGGVDLGASVVDIVSSPSGAGYWIFASDARVFAFGDATYQGGLRVGVLAAAPFGSGYALLVPEGAIVLPRLRFVASPRDEVPIDLVEIDGAIWFLYPSGDVVSADGASTLEASPAQAVARAHQSVDCSR
ncbi:MAG: S8 family serine peptidase, partial [Actinomycetia bacterium]|nr:S8 family serine peptidase [Actinomycetes bacterium]